MVDELYTGQRQLRMMGESLPKERQSKLEDSQAQLDLVKKNRSRKTVLRGNGFASEVAEDEAVAGRQLDFLKLRHQIRPDIPSRASEDIGG
jgi:hypothetical protein